MNKKLEVLCVDDEPAVLEGLRMHLKQRYVVHFACSGAEALDKLRENKNIAVIMSDMRMPVMDGAKFLHAARAVAPDSVRMLLTGYADIQSAMAAVNEGQIFRFISKPCAPNQLQAAFESATIQHRLIVAEKVLLQQTLLGCVESLTKVLSLSKPVAFGRALRLRSKTRALLERLSWEERWQIEAAAVLSQMGAVTLSEEILLKLNDGEKLDGAERREIAASIVASIKMLEAIPRLEPALDIMQQLAGIIRDNGSSSRLSADVQLLHIVLEWDAVEAQGYGQAEAFSILSTTGLLNADMLETLGSASGGGGTHRFAASVAAEELRPGMILAQDLLGKNGITILPRGFEIDLGLLDHIQNFAGQLADTAIHVYTPA